MTTITSRKELPDMPYFVLSNDKFMSGWGDAVGKINTVVLPCRSYGEAMNVMAHAKGRGDQSRVRIVSGKPRLSPSRVCYSLHDHNDYGHWYTGYMTIERRITDKDYPFAVRFEGAGFDRRGFIWGGMHKDFWSAFDCAAEIAHTCGYRKIEIELTGKL